jgi:hypothetical protein
MAPNDAKLIGFRVVLNSVADLRVSTVLPHNGSATRLPASLLPGFDGIRSPAF